MVCTDATGGAPGCRPALLDPWASGLPPAYLTLIRTGSGHANRRMGKFGLIHSMARALGTAAPYALAIS